MTDILRKYKLLDKSAKRELEDFLDALINKKSTTANKKNTKYRDNLLQISTWSEEDINLFIKNQSLLYNWDVEEW